MHTVMLKISICLTLLEFFCNFAPIWYPKFKLNCSSLCKNLCSIWLVTNTYWSNALVINISPFTSSHTGFPNFRVEWQHFWLNFNRSSLDECIKSWIGIEVFYFELSSYGLYSFNFLYSKIDIILPLLTACNKSQNWSEIVENYSSNMIFSVKAL